MTKANYGGKTVTVRVPVDRVEEVKQYLLGQVQQTQCNSYPPEVEETVTVMLDKIKEFAPPDEICDGVNRIVWWIEAELMPVINKAEAINQKEALRQQQRLSDEWNVNKYSKP